MKKTPLALITALQEALDRLKNGSYNKAKPDEVLDNADGIATDWDHESLEAISNLQQQLAGNDPKIAEAIEKLKKLIKELKQAAMTSVVQIDDDTMETTPSDTHVIGELPSAHTEESPRQPIDPSATHIDQPTAAPPPIIPAFKRTPLFVEEPTPPVVEADPQLIDSFYETPIHAPKREALPEPQKEEEQRIVHSERSVSHALGIVLLLLLSSILVLGGGLKAVSLWKTHEPTTEKQIVRVPQAQAVEAVEKPSKAVLPSPTLPSGPGINCKNAAAYQVGSEQSVLVKTGGVLWLMQGVAVNNGTCVFANGSYANQLVPASCLAANEADDRICPKRKQL